MEPRRAVPSEPRERITLVELEGVVRLRLEVDADHLEPGAVIANRAAASATEEVKDPHALALRSWLPL
jgi:hypothetical protein